MLTVNQLETWLWDAANILRGPVDAADFKSYIFPMLFFKRISDVYEEEYDQALEESGGDVEYALFAENHRFNIPVGCLWKDLREVTKDVGLAIQRIFRSIEKANAKTLYGIFGDVQWSNKEKLSDKLLKDLIEHFSQYNLSNANVEPDIAGQAYEYLIKKFADETNKKAGEFYTPRSIVKLMTMILDPNAGESVYGPSMRTGGMLLQAIHHVAAKGGDIRTLKLYGQEKNLTTSAIARMNLLLHGVEDFNIVREDTLRNPVFTNRDKLATFDCVIANPPFSLKNWGQDIWISDRWGRNEFGVPPANFGDFAWVEHMIKSMATSTGRLAVVVPNGVLFRKGESKIRENIVMSDKLEAVISLGENLFYGTTLAACIMVFKEKKEAYKKNRVLFVDASKIYKKQRAQNILQEEHISVIYKLYADYQDVEGIVKVVDFDEIQKHNFNLVVQMYVGKKTTEEILPISEAIEHVNDAFDTCKEANNLVKEKLMEMGLRYGLRK